MDAASPHLARLGAASRPVGDAGEAREYCARVLRAAGFIVTEQPFEFSYFPGAWATPLAGAGVALFAGAAYLGRGTAVAWLVLAAVVAVIVPIFAYVARFGVLDLPLMRRAGVNVCARRRDGEPRVWLVAHLDSKSQPVSMITRVGGVALSAAGLIGVIIVCVVGLGARGVAANVVLAVSWLGAIPLLLSTVGRRNHGTLDNASGVSAVLHAAESMPPSVNVGVLITDGEELGLAGARAWARSRSPGVALNCDSIDDEGRLTVMHAASTPRTLLAALDRACEAAGEPARIIRLIPGVLTDHVALAAAGWETATLSRGNLRTLQRVHTMRDTLANMRGTGIALAARVLTRTATELS